MKSQVGVRHQRRILCVFPRYAPSFGTFQHAYPLTDGVRAFMPPQGILVVAAYLPAQWQVRLVDENNRLARVEIAGVRRNVNVSLLDDDGVGAQPGDWVLIHVGFALSKVDEEEAHATLALLQGMGAEYEQELEELKASAIE